VPGSLWCFAAAAAAPLPPVLLLMRGEANAALSGIQLLL
jgi:hypothetical protein